MRASERYASLHSGMVSPPKSERDRHKSEGTRPYHSSTVSPPMSERDRDANVLQVIGSVPPNRKSRTLIESLVCLSVCSPVTANLL
ncbi:hypothetical protein EVAR_9107_1 [Eumeta japonica]|uniref:Uncharacterized protein n=1 Tax=Eumeta variegata TaxID=151549 RepID=A0A4C1TWK6_EUMVA|nr:hypothetical protein EVAR_9107_1 [Eumeta japonica]